ncbi:hypothetical protein NDA01_23950 [Trichocoleus desertorum AS-A10]|uniref:hypothetical protein n=1 Tax=Trichocoleus desertorum TaxID=1481672 RepID=UPI0032988CD1
MQLSTIAQIKSAVFAQITASTASQVKDWAERHGLNVDLRTKAGWQQVLEAIAVQLKPAAEQAIATAKEAAVAVRDADYGQLKQDVYDKALQFKVAAVDGTLDAYATLKQHWGPALRLTWDIARLVTLWTAIAAIYCLRAGQQFRAFVDELEYTGMGPHQIAWCFANPLAKRARKLGYVTRDRVQVWALNRFAEVKRLARLRRVREAVAYGAVSFAGVATAGLIG